MNDQGHASFGVCVLYSSPKTDTEYQTLLRDAQSVTRANQNDRENNLFILALITQYINKKFLYERFDEHTKHRMQVESNLLLEHMSQLGYYK